MKSLKSLFSIRRRALRRTTWTETRTFVLCVALSSTKAGHAQEVPAGAAGGFDTTTLLFLMGYLLGAILVIAIVPRLLFSLIWNGGPKDPFLAVRLAYAGTLAILGILFPLCGFWPRFVAPMVGNAIPYAPWIIGGVVVLISLLLPVLGKKMPGKTAVGDGTADDDLI